MRGNTLRVWIWELHTPDHAGIHSYQCQEQSKSMKNERGHRISIVLNSSWNPMRYTALCKRINETACLYCSVGFKSVCLRLEKFNWTNAVRHVYTSASVAIDSKRRQRRRNHRRLSLTHARQANKGRQPPLYYWRSWRHPSSITHGCNISNHYFSLVHLSTKEMAPPRC